MLPTFNQIIVLLLLSCIPFADSRFAIPYALSQNGLGMSVFWVYVISTAINIAGGLLIYHTLGWIKIGLDKIKPLHKIKEKYINRISKSAKPLIHRWAHWGLTLFIAIPLPGSGTMSGAIVANIFGITKKHFYIANTIGAAVNVGIILLISIGLF